MLTHYHMLKKSGGIEFEGCSRLSKKLRTNNSLIFPAPLVSFAVCKITLTFHEPCLFSNQNRYHNKKKHLIKVVALSNHYRKNIFILFSSDWKWLHEDNRNVTNKFVLNMIVLGFLFSTIYPNHNACWMWLIMQQVSLH